MFPLVLRMRRMIIKLKHLGEIDFIFKTNLGCGSVDQVGSFEAKKLEAKNLMEVCLSVPCFLQDTVITCS